MGAADTDAHARVLAAVDAAADELVELVGATVRVPSVTGDEGLVAGLYERWLRDAGFEVHTRCVDPLALPGDAALDTEHDLERRPNVYGWTSRRRGRPVIALNGHMDVIAAGDGWHHDPFGGEAVDGRVLGRGAADMKGGLAAGMIAARSVRDAGVALHCDVVVQCVIAEETGGLGTRFALATEPRPTAAIVLEPTSCTVASACGGMIPFRIDLVGRAAHTSVPWAGASAFERLQTALAALVEDTRRREAACTHPLFAALRAPAPLAVGEVHAGDHWGTLPDRAHLAGRIGVLPGERVADVRHGLEARLATVAADAGWPPDEAPRASFTIDGFGAWETDPEQAVVAGLRAASARVTGDERRGAVTFGSDASAFHDAGVPVALYGPGSIADAHTKDEFVAIDELRVAARVLAVALVEQSHRIQERFSTA